MALTVAGYVVAQEDPAYVETEPGEPEMLVFPIADAGIGTYAGQELQVDRLLIGDVVCRGALAGRAAAVVTAGTVVRVVGRLSLHSPLDYPQDGSTYVSMAIEADDVALAYGEEG